MSKGKSHLTISQRRAISGYCFILPFIIGFLLFFLPSVIQSIIYCFNKIVIVDSGYELKWVGLQNFKKVFLDSTNARDAIAADLKILGSNFLVILIFSMFVAIILNSKFKGKVFARVIFFLPVIISMGFVLEINEQAILQGVSGMQDVAQQAASEAAQKDVFQNITVVGMLYQILFNFKLPMDFVDFIVRAIDNIYSIVQRCGVQILIFLAALQSIPPSIFEASNIEGATGWENFWKITLPMLSPMIMANAVYTFVDLTYSPTSRVMAFISGQETVLAACASWGYALIIFILLTIVVLIISKYVFYQE